MEVALQILGHTNETVQHKAKTCPSEYCKQRHKVNERCLEGLKCVLRDKKLIYTARLTGVQKVKRNYR